MSRPHGEVGYAPSTVTAQALHFAVQDASEGEKFICKGGGSFKLGLRGSLLGPAVLDLEVSFP